MVNMFIVIIIKWVNYGKIRNICGKLNFTTNYIPFTETDTKVIKKHTHQTIFDTRGGTVRSGDLEASCNL